jgi:hypothetical protein
MKKNFLFRLAVCLLLPATAPAAPQPSVQAVFTQTPPRIDGRIEELWYAAAPVSDFRQRLPETGQPVSESTQVYILYDRDYLYLAFRCSDDPRRITAKELARDVSLGEDDRVQIIIDTFHDRRNAYWFQIGPRGSIGDALVSENGLGFNKEWDGLWDGRAVIHETGWDAEMIIPFKTLNFKPGLDTWGLKMIRHIRRRLESAYWPEANLDTYTFQVSDGGLLTGLEGITKGIGVDVRPYAITGLEHHYGQKNKGQFNLGGDVFYRLTPGIKAALTINTDFAQTEVDSRQINLTRFNLLFPEKRGFFLDGANYFNFGSTADASNPYGKRNIPFFSRRVGLDDNREPIPIVWGLKLTGQAGHWNIGVQHMADKPGDKLRNLSVGRVTYNLGRQSYIGMIATNGNTLDSTGNQTVGFDLRLATSSFQGNKNAAFTAYALKSNTAGLGGNDLAYGLDLSYPNDFLRLRLGHQMIGDHYKPGIGFVPRPGIREYYGENYFGFRPKKWGLLRVETGAGINYITGLDNELQTRRIPVTPLGLEFRSGERVVFSGYHEIDRFEEEFAIFPKDSISIPAGEYQYWRNMVLVQSALRRNLWGSVSYSWGGFYDGYRQELTIRSGYKVLVPLFVGIEYERNRVFLQDGAFSTTLYRLNADILFSPRITLTNYIQYDDVSETMGWQSRFRWILQPGNEILLVWNSSLYEPLAADRFVIADHITRLKLNYNFRF